ncbi:MAG: tRNA 4-thiouridine(8) synthase ThiI [Lentisphaerae bacterium]|nr:tRNA 4-thiouridine(8) synthase ThiI [Lentisphaerota bacterium]
MSDSVGDRRIRALMLLSGGLDSRLAVCVLRKQGIEVQGIVFDSPFFDLAPARAASEQLGVPLHVQDFSADILELLNAPRHGFGSCMNPCIDCHARMLRRAGERMRELGCRFICTGEVLDERPMSQNRASLDLVARESGFAEWIVRPLSAGLLPATEPEQRGWVARDALLSLRGRGRKPQLRLAEQFGLREIPPVAGGCRLTEPNFSRRLRDLKDHEGLNGVRSIFLLRYGRHFRLADKVKLIVGRNEQDNAVLDGTAELYELLLQTEDARGPTGLLPNTANEAQVRFACAICARYSDVPPDRTVMIRVRSPRRSWREAVLPVAPEDIEPLRV